MKALKPSVREKKRYLLVRGRNLKTNIEKAILEFIGVLGMSKTALCFIKTNTKPDTTVISINRKAVDHVRASLTVFSEPMEVVRVSGTLKGLKKK